MTPITGSEYPCCSNCCSTEESYSYQSHLNVKSDEVTVRQALSLIYPLEPQFQSTDEVWTLCHNCCDTLTRLYLLFEEFKNLCSRIPSTDSSVTKNSKSNSDSNAECDLLPSRLSDFGDLQIKKEDPLCLGGVGTNEGIGMRLRRRTLRRNSFLKELTIKVVPIDHEKIKAELKPLLPCSTETDEHELQFPPDISDTESPPGKKGAKRGRRRTNAKKLKKQAKTKKDSGVDPDSTLTEDKESGDRKPPNRQLSRAPGSKIRRRSNRRANIRYVCAEEGCPFEAQKKEDYLEHLSITHGKEGVELIPLNASDAHVCFICNSVFNSEEELSHHCSLTHIPFVKVRSHHCTQCSKSFVNKNDLRNHEALHTLTTSYACDQCPFKTRRTQELERHCRLIHLQEKNFFCSVCNKGFALRWQLIDHERVHREERMFTCTEAGCFKSFKTPSNLRQHRELHRGAKYVCHICGQSYSRKAYLRLHVNGTHLMLPLPPSLTRERRSKDPDASAKRPKVKSNKDSKSKTREPRIRNGNVGRKRLQPVTEEECAGTEDSGKTLEAEERLEENDEVVMLDEFPQEPLADFVIHPDDDEGTIHVHMDLDSTGTEDILDEGELVVGDGGANTTFSLPDGQQIICYPVGSLDMVPVIADGGNTFYITTTSAQIQDPEEPPTAITVFNPFTEFMSIQQQQ